MAYGQGVLDDEREAEVSMLASAVAALEVRQRTLMRQLNALQSEIAALTAVAEDAGAAIVSGGTAPVARGAADAAASASSAVFIAHDPTTIAHAVAAAVVSSERLTLIRGLTPDDAARLNTLGIDCFADLASLTQDDVAEIGRVIGDRRRVSREGWIEQAAMLAAGVDTAYARARRLGAEPDGRAATSASLWSQTLPPVGDGVIVLTEARNKRARRRGVSVSIVPGVRWAAAVVAAVVTLGVPFGGAGPAGRLAALSAVGTPCLTPAFGELPLLARCLFRPILAQGR